MCGRYTLTSPHDAIAESFETGSAPILAARYNLAPSQESIIVTAAADTNRRARRARWGFSLEQRGTKRFIINARAESVERREAFKESFAAKRCLVPANGFFEWIKIGLGRQPYYFRTRESSLIAFAGLWSEDENGDLRYVILTTQANDVVGRVHHRMPVILGHQNHGPWIAPGPLDESAAGLMLRPWPSTDTTSEAVGMRVNDVACDEPQCIQPLMGPVDLFTN